MSPGARASILYSPSLDGAAAVIEAARFRALCALCALRALRARGLLIERDAKSSASTAGAHNMSGSGIRFSDQLTVKAKLSVCHGELKFPRGEVTVCS